MTSRFKLDNDGADVQAIVRSGFGSLTHACYLLLQIDDPVQARAWIAQMLAERLIKSVADMNAVKEVAFLAFSYAGLRALGLREHPDFPFPSSFRRGMADPIRMPLLGDRSHAAWTWADIAAEHFSGVHVVVAHYRQRSFDDKIALIDVTNPAPHGVSLVKMIRTCPYYIRAGREPFGFKDGLAQPVLTELMKCESIERREDEGGATFEDDKVMAGEFVLGYANSYGERSYCPDVAGWERFAGRTGGRFARNGSYLAVRQIEQDIAAFNKFDVHEREKMFGRTFDGKPLVTDPGRLPKPEKDLNDFRYRLADTEGFQCPRGAHVRRANPRDALGWDVPSGVAASKLHRLIRRGRVYTDSSTCGASCGSDDASAGCGNGLFFIALNADLDRQFEFVQQRWFTNSKFGDLWDEADPALGDGGDRSFSIPGCLPVGTRLHNLPQFTTVRGGGYFFLPGLSALRFMAEVTSAATDLNSGVPLTRPQASTSPLGEAAS